MASIRYRGTPEAPGLVLALDRDAGGQLRGRRLPRAARPRRRRRSTTCGRASWSPTPTTRRACRLGWRAARRWRRWPTSRTARIRSIAAGLSLEEQAEVIARAVGPRGPNADYLLNTVESLEALGLHDPELERLAELVRARS